jgi:hypothetical protein
MTAFDDIRKQIGLDESSRVFVISTEGNTDPENYEVVVRPNQPLSQISKSKL